jgi:phosphoglycerate dehydrogenase-like enzyme/glyoxylase-like metal-dependent hydrolase (beta-lactamase superfamily II)
MGRVLFFVAAAGLFLAAEPCRAADDLPQMKFNDVKEVAPGVFFRYSAISATDDKVVFGGSNNVWVVFDDYVVVIDANFPQGAQEVIDAVKKTTDKPIRYVFDTHHHGDHAYGNAVFAKAGASVIAQVNCARLLRINGPKEFADAGKGPTGRKDVADSSLKVPNVIFDDKLVLDDGKQRIEFLFLGHAHTAGDAVAYLPKHKILCTGDACVNGAFNYMGNSDSSSWIRALERMQQLDAKTICPGHGPLTDKGVIEKQKRYFVELRQYVKKGIDAHQDADTIAKNVDLPWYKEWTGVQPTGPNVKFVYDELTGRTLPWDLVEDFGLLEGPSPTKLNTPGWKAPRRIVVPSGLMPARLEELKLIAPEVEFIPAKSVEDAAKVVGDADAVVGFCSAEILKSGKNLRWIQAAHTGLEKELGPEIKNNKIVITDTQRLAGPQTADQAFALLLTLTRKLRGSTANQPNGGDAAGVPEELHGKTMLVVGLGGVGTQIGRRANAFGMRVLAIDPRDMERPDFVFSLEKPTKLMDLLPKADVVVLACPLTEETKGLMDAKQFGAMKKTAYFVNVARDGLVQSPALVKALESNQVAGAGLAVTDPEHLPADSPLAKLGNAVLTANSGIRSSESQDRQWRLFRENVRRFVAGEPLLCVVDKFSAD